MGDAVDHAADLWAIGVLDGVVDPAKPEGAQRASLLGLDSDRRAGLGDAQGRGHGYLTSVVSRLGA